MHQKEAKRQRTGTGHIAKISLKDSEILVGFEFEHNKRLQELLADPQYFPVMMYPGEEAWTARREGFAQTISPHLCHVTGALAYAIGQDKLNKSQFYIVTGEEVTPELFGMLRDQYGKTFTPEVEALYQQSGGQPFLDGGYEVFGQVFDGLDKCLEIQKVAVNSETSKPKSAVVIEKAVIAEYDGAPPHYLNAAGEDLQIGSSGLNDEG